MKNQIKYAVNLKKGDLCAILKYGSFTPMIFAGEGPTTFQFYYNTPHVADMLQKGEKVRKEYVIADGNVSHRVFRMNVSELPKEEQDSYNDIINLI